MAEKRPDRGLSPPHDEFWSHCNKEELRLQRCQTCRQLAWPAVNACQTCGSSELAWELVSGHGKVISWCTFERSYYKELPIPWDAVLVELEEGPLFISNPKGFTWQATTPNMPVKVAFIDCEDKAGAFKLPVFEKA